MSDSVATARAFSARDAKRKCKALLRAGLALFDVSEETAAGWCDVSRSLVNQWCDPSREPCPPAWAFSRIAQCHAQLSHFLRSGMEAEYGAAPAPALPAEARGNVTTGMMGALIAANAAALAGDGKYQPHEARELAPLAAKLMAALAPFVADMATLARLDDAEGSA